MIVKKVASKGSGSFRGLANYILDAHKLHKDKVENINFTHCGFGNIEDNIDLIENTQKLNDSDADKTMHLIISFQEDEKPTQEQLADIEEEMLRSIGLEDHQRLSVTHTNTNNYHLHIAINRIDTQTFKRADPYRSKLKLQRKAAELEEKHFLKKDNHIPKWKLGEEQSHKSNNTRTEKEVIYEPIRKQYTGRENRVLRLLQSITQRFRRRPAPEPISSMRKLSGIDVVHNRGRTKVLLSSNERDYLRRRGGKDNNKLRRPGASNSSTTGRGAVSEDIKAHTGITNISEWIKENVLDDLKQILTEQNSSWKDLHTLLAKYNLELKERGNGFILRDKTRKLFVKASSAHRDLSKAKLIKKYGVFEEPEKKDIKPIVSFGRERTNFWDKYQEEMQTTRQTKQERRAELKEAYTNQKEKIKKKYHLKIRLLKAEKKINRFIKIVAYQKLYANQKAELKEAYENYQLSGTVITNKNKHISYKEYLIREALRGDSKALSTLRHQKPPKPKENDNTVGGKINHQLYSTKKPLITKRGFVVYRLDADNDQSKIIDKGNHMKIANASDEALLKALEMARTKYGREVDINGSEEFKTKVISLVATNKIDMKFKDVHMQRALNAATTQTKDKKQKIKKSGLEM